MPGIFLSYRRKDAAGHAELIYRHLVEEFGSTHVSKDVNAFRLGADFRAEMNRHLKDCTVMLAVIGSHWLEHLQNQANNPDADDHLVVEIETALQLPVPIVPVFVEGAKMPEPGELCPKIRALAFQNGIPVHEPPHSEACLRLLVERLRKDFPELPPRPSAGTDDKPPIPPKDTRKGRSAIFVATVIVAGLWFWRDVMPPSMASGAMVGALVYNECWVTYDPGGMRLDARRQASVTGDASSVSAELGVIRDAGFSGVMLSGADGVLAEVPKLARQQGLRVILGVWNPADRHEIRRAIAQSDWVDAYCVGATGLPSRYGSAELCAAVDILRRRTGRPVAVSENVAAYEDEELASLGDWLFPDAHLTLKDRDDKAIAIVDLDRDLARFGADAEKMALIARKSSRPLMFHHVGFPYAGVDGASREVQAEFFRRLLEHLFDERSSYATKIGIVAQTAFDTPWKVEHPFLAWDPWAGLIEEIELANITGIRESSASRYRLSAAGRVILKWFPHLRASVGSAEP